MPRGLLRQSTQVLKSRNFNIDNGAGTTVDDAISVGSKPINLQKAYIVYTTETAGTVAAANVTIGTTVGGTDIAAATAYANSSTVGTTTAITLVKTHIPANTMIDVRHTGSAATALGEAYVVIEYTVDE